MNTIKTIFLLVLITITYIISTILGQICKNATIDVSLNSQIISINTIDLPKGTYLLTIENNNEKLVRKVIK